MIFVRINFECNLQLFVIGFRLQFAILMHDLFIDINMKTYLSVYNFPPKANM